MREFFHSSKNWELIESKFSDSSPPLEVVYKVSACNTYGWSDFSDGVGIHIDTTDIFRDTSSNSGEQEGGLTSKELDRICEPKDQFPHFMLGLDENVLEKPEHFERSMRLPNISRKYKGAPVKQKPGMTERVWFSYIPVDAKTLVERRERLMKYRAKSDN